MSQAHRLVETPARVGGVVAGKLHEQPSLGNRRNQQLERRLRAPRQGQVPAVKKVAGARSQGE